MNAQRPSFPVRLAETVGVLHFIFANIIIGLGERTGYFSWIPHEYPGVQFLYQYVDKPIAMFILSLPLGDMSTDPRHYFLVAEFVVVTASIVYGFITYVLAKFLSFLLSF